MSNLDTNSNKKLLMSVENIAVSYNQNRSILKKRTLNVLKDVSFEIYSGNTIGVLGKNGAGKSTLMKVLANIIKPNKGTVRNFGASVSLLSLSNGFDKELTGRQNVYLSGLLMGFKKQDISNKIESIISFSELGNYIDVPLRTYSSGMRSRLGFAIANSLTTDILLVDETLSVGDKDFKRKSSVVMQEKIKSQQTVVLVSHNESIIKELCTHALVVENGNSKFFGEVEEAINHL